MFYVLLRGYRTYEEATLIQEKLVYTGTNATVIKDNYIQVFQGKNKTDAEMYADVFANKGYNSIVVYKREVE